MNLRQLAIWGVIAVVIAGLYVVMTQTTKAANGAAGEMSYSQMLHAIDSGQVHKAVIRGDVVEAEDPDGKPKFIANTPFPQTDLIEHLEKQNVDFSIKPASNNPALAIPDQHPAGGADRRRLVLYHAPDAGRRPRRHGLRQVQGPAADRKQEPRHLR